MNERTWTGDASTGITHYTFSLRRPSPVRVRPFVSSPEFTNFPITSFLSLSSFFLSVPSLEPLTPESTQHNKTALISAAPKDTAAAAMSELDSAICGAVA